MSEVETPVEGAETLPETPAQPEAQETPQEPATATPDTPAEPEQPRDEGGRFQKRVNELTRKQYEARREAEQARQERDQLRAELDRLRQPAAPDPSLDPQGYIRHLASQEARQIVEQERSQWQQSQQQQHIQSLAQQYTTREEAYSAQHPDYQEAADAFTSVAGVNPELAEVLMTSEHGPAVVHYLGMHLDEAASITQMPVHLAAAAVARIEARVSAPKPKPTTQTPAPVPTLGGSSAVQKDPSKLSYADYRKEREAGRIK